jgi:hypothetical protein
VGNLMRSLVGNDLWVEAKPSWLIGQRPLASDS